jgi:hypothetical protein
MASATTGRRPASVGARRAGYAAAVAINGLLLFGINVAPGWSIVPFLTPDISAVLPWINASLVAGILANAVYLFRDTRRVKGLGDLITAVVGLVATVRLWQVFPFDFGAEPNAWSTVVRVLLIVAIAGTGIAVIVGVVTALRSRSGSVPS